MNDVTIQIGPINAYYDTSRQRHILESSDAAVDRSGHHKPTQWEYTSYFTNEESVTPLCSGGYSYFIAGPPEDAFTIVGVPFSPQSPATAWVVVASRGDNATPAGIAKICHVLVDVMTMLDVTQHDGHTAAQSSAMDVLLLVMSYIRKRIDDFGIMLSAWRETTIDSNMALEDQLAKVLLYGPLVQVVVHPILSLDGSARHAMILIVAAHGDVVEAEPIEHPVGFGGGTAERPNAADSRLLEAERCLGWLGITRHNCHTPTALDAFVQYELFVEERLSVEQHLYDTTLIQWHQELLRKARSSLAVLRDPTERFVSLHASTSRTKSDVVRVRHKDAVGYLEICAVPADPEERTIVDATGLQQYPPAFVYAIISGDHSDDITEPTAQLMHSSRELHRKLMGGFEPLSTHLALIDKGLADHAMAMNTGMGLSIGTLSDLADGSLLAFVVVDRTCSTRSGDSAQMPRSTLTQWSAVKHRRDRNNSDDRNAPVFTMSSANRRDLFEAYFRRCIWRAVDYMTNGYIEGTFEGGSLLFRFGRYRVEPPASAGRGQKQAPPLPAVVTPAGLPVEYLMRPHNHRRDNDAVGSPVASGTSSKNGSLGPTLYVELYAIFCAQEPVSADTNISLTDDAVAKLLRLYYEAAK